MDRANQLSRRRLLRQAAKCAERLDSIGQQLAAASNDHVAHCIETGAMDAKRWVRKAIDADWEYLRKGSA